MRKFNDGRKLVPVQIEARKLAQRAGLPFQELLPQNLIDEAIAAQGLWFRECVYTPDVAR
jgi:hypothetical protein